MFELDRLFGDVFTTGATASNWRYRWSSRDRTLTVCLPGVKRDAIDVEVVENNLTVAVRGESDWTASGKMRWRLPFDTRDVKASFNDGVLAVALHKNAEQHSVRKIELE